MIRVNHGQWLVEEFPDKEYTAEQHQALIDYMNTRAEHDLPELSRNEWRRKVNNAIGFSAYIELSRLRIAPRNARGANVLGYAFGSWTGVIYVNHRLQGARYGRTLLHELVHHVFWIFNERRTEFYAFRIAYNANCPHMFLIARQVAMRGSPSDYVARGRIIDYLTQRGAIA